MTELEELRRAFAERPSLDEAEIREVRRQLLAKIHPRRRLPSRLALAAAALVAVSAIVAVAVPRGKALTGGQILAATRRALTPPPNAMLHVVVHDQDARNGTTERWTEEQWRAPSPPYELRVITRGGFDDGESVLSKCGTVGYRTRLDMFTVDTGRLPNRALRDLIEPARAFSAYGTVLSRSKTTFHGVPAYRLDLGHAVEFLVRRDTFYPLRVVVGSYVRTFSTFEQLPRDERLLRIQPRPGAFLLRTSAGRYFRRAGCDSFATYSSLMGAP
jgi:hypothetical protein